MFKNTTIELKLKINAAIVVLGLIVLGIFSYSTISTLEEHYKDSKELSNKVDNYKSILIGGLLTNSSSGVYAFNPKSTKPLKASQSGIDKVKEFSKMLPKKERTKEFQSFISVAQETVNFAIKEKYLDPTNLNKLLKTWRPLKFEVMKRLKTLKIKQQHSAKAFKEELNKLVIVILIMLAGISSLVIIVNFLISKGIIKSLNTLEKSMENLASGNKSEKINLSNNDETATIAKHFNTYMDNVEKGIAQDKIVINEVKSIIEKINAGIYNTKVHSHANSKEVEELVQALNGMIDKTSYNLQELSTALIAYGNSNFEYKIPKIEGVTGLIASMLMGIRATGNTVSELLALIDNSNKKLLFSSKELTVSASNLSNASNSQAASLEQTSAAIEEVTTAMGSSAQNTVKMSQYAKEVTQSADEGKELANRTAQSMDEITSEVTAINEAISVIDQISFQTNILSLNAAVEAATAGEAGKGFAVVAQEVRNLASRSADAANEIKSLVEKANEKASRGKDIADKMISGYGKLNNNITHTIELIDTVTKATEEQRGAMIQINDAVTHLDQTTQQNASEAGSISKLAADNEALAGNLQSAINSTNFNNECKRRVCDSKMIFDVAKLKLNHLDFKDDAFSKAGKGESFTLKTDKECALGKWIIAHEGTHMAQSNEWAQLKESHEKVHGMTQGFVNLHAQGCENSQLFTTADGIEENIEKVFDSLNIVRERNCDSKFKG